MLATPVSTPMQGGGDDRFTAIQANETLRVEVKDLSEKLETLKGMLSKSKRFIIMLTIW